MDLEEKENPAIFKKDKQKSKQNDKLDAKGMDTLFRTISRNHYNLLRMVDNKASIVLTVNSILISLLFGATQIAPEGGREQIEFFLSTLTYSCLGSMVFALIGMMPHTYYGKKYKSSSYNGSLYASNFAKKSLSEFDRLTETRKSIYDEMILDLYFLGRAIRFKQAMIKFALFTFLIGLVWAVFYAQIYY